MLPERFSLLLASTALCIAASPAHAETTPSQREMMDLIKAQAERIRVLESRLDAMAAREAQAPVPVSTPAQAQPTVAPSVPVIAVQIKRPPADPEMHIDWDSGTPSFYSPNETFSFRPRGRVMLDLDTTWGSQFAARNTTATGSRAARIGFEGTFFDKGFYTFDVEFAEPSATEVLSAFIGFHDEAGKLDYDVRLGNMFNDRSLEGQTGSQNTPLLERNFVANAIMPRRAFYGLGTMARVFGPHWHASVTLAGDPIDGDVSTSDSLSLSARAHWNPVKSQNDTIHIGAWGFREWLRGEGRSLTRNTMLAARFNTNLRISTGPLIDTDRSTGYGAELAWTHRNLYTWAEYGRRDIAFRPGAVTPDFSIEAWSIAGGWVLTGEDAPYSARQGNFRPMKIENSLADGGIGTIELVVRHQKLDNEQTQFGGTGRETSLGLNWYPVPLLRFTVNWTHWDVTNRTAPFDAADDGDAIATRAQIVF